MKKPFLAEPGSDIVVGVEAVFEAVDAIRRAGKKAAFVDAYSKSGLQLRVPAEIVNFVKNFMFDGGLHREVLGAASVVKSTRCPKAEG